MHEHLEKKHLLDNLYDPDPGSSAFEMCPREPMSLSPAPVIDCCLLNPTHRGTRKAMSQSGGWVSDTPSSSSSGQYSLSSSGGSDVSCTRQRNDNSRTASFSDKIPPVDDIKCLNYNQLVLRTCGYYYEGISRLEAKEKLRQCKVGTFLLRDSADPKFLFSLSVKTKRGITSVRLEYRAGRWRMDCEDRLVNQMPEFDTVVELVDFYIKLSRNDRNNQCVWLESCGRRDTPVKLVTPIRKGPISLQHACRLVISKNTHVRNVHKLNLPTSMKCFLQEYPYSH